MTLESYLEKVKSLWGQRGKKSWMADWERIAVELWREKIKLQGFCFCLTQFLCVVSAPKLQCEEECVPRAVWSQQSSCSAVWDGHFRSSRRAVVPWNVAPFSELLAESPPAALCPRQSWAGLVLLWVCPPLHGHQCHHTVLGTPWAVPRLAVFICWVTSRHSSCPAALPQQRRGNSQAFV